MKNLNTDDSLKKSLITSSSTSSSLSDHLFLQSLTPPKPILKKSPQQSPPSSDQDRIPPSYQDQKKFTSLIQSKSLVTLNPMKLQESLIPKPAPRPSLKQTSVTKRAASLV